MSQGLPASAAVYGRLMLSVYDLYVLGLSNRFIWQCPTQKILDLYNRLVTDRHLDVGVGTGFYLDRARFPSNEPRIDLMDINPMALSRTAQRIRRYRPNCILQDVGGKPDGLVPRFDSIAINYLLHCLPGRLEEKGGSVLSNLVPLMSSSGGCLFGATILGAGSGHNAVSRRLLSFYNRKGIFGNLSDSEEQLEDLLKAHFDRFDLEVNGCVALFAGYR